MWQFWACHLHLFVKGWDFLLLLVFWCFVIMPLQYPFLTICILIRSFWEHFEGGETRGGEEKRFFFTPMLWEFAIFQNSMCFSTAPMLSVQGSQVFVCYRYSLFFPIPSGTELSLIKIMLFTETDFLGGGLFCLKFKRRKTLNKFVVAPVPPLLLLWRSTEGCLYLVSTVPWWRVIVQKACSGNCWTEDCQHTRRCSLLITQLVNNKLVPSGERFATERQLRHYFHCVSHNVIAKNRKHASVCVGGSWEVEE